MTYISRQYSDEILTLTISRPERLNAIGPTVAQELWDILRPLWDELSNIKNPQKQPPSTRALIIRANPIAKPGGLVWLSGGDLKESTTLKTPAEGKSYVVMVSSICELLENLPIPVIMACDGAVIGGAIEFYLAADLRLATAHSTFAFKQLDIGLATGFGGARRLVKMVGKASAQHFLYTRQNISAAEAQKFSFVNQVAKDSDDLEKQLQQISQQMLATDAAAFAVQKKMLNLAVDNAFGAPHRHAEAELFAQLWQAPAHKNVLEKFSSK